MTMKLPAASIANAFLELQESDTSVYPKINNMKLQKLVFYSHAWWLALYEESLFEDDVEAWPWGPVVRDIYLQFKDYGREPIPAGVRAKTYTISENIMETIFKIPSKPIEKQLDFLKSIWDTHKKFTGIQLSNATHAVGEPWTLIHNSLEGNLSSTPTIPNEVIRDVFRRKIAK